MNNNNDTIELENLKAIYPIIKKIILMIDNKKLVRKIEFVLLKI